MIELDTMSLQVIPASLSQRLTLTLFGTFLDTLASAILSKALCLCLRFLVAGIRLRYAIEKKLFYGST